MHCIILCHIAIVVNATTCGCLHHAYALKQINICIVTVKQIFKKAVKRSTAEINPAYIILPDDVGCSAALNAIKIPEAVRSTAHKSIEVKATFAKNFRSPESQ